MSDLSDVNMDGVKPMSEHQDLPNGQYLVRLEDTEKKETKEKYGDDGQKLPPNYYLQISAKVYGGPNDGHVEFIRLNLWNTNQTAVNMAKSELKSIQEAIGVASQNSKDMINKWLILEVKPGIKDPTKSYRYYSPCPAEILANFKDVPPVEVKAPAFIAKEVAAANAAAAAAQPAAATGSPQPALPSWAQKKTA